MRAISCWNEPFRAFASLMAECRVLVSVALLCCAASSGARAQSPAPLSTPNMHLHGAGSVLASASLADSSVIVGGTFTSFNDVPRSNIAKFKSTGELDPSWFPAVDGPITAIAVDNSNGDIYIGGTFGAVNGTARSSIAKLHADGSLDTNWFPAGVTPSFFGGGVFALCLDGAGSLFVGGQFDFQLNVFKVSTTGTGAVDASWNVYPDDAVYALAYDGASLYVGGAFTTIHANGVDVARHLIAKLSPTGTGTVDSTWNPQADAIALDDAAYALAADGSGNLFVGGSFASMGGDPTGGGPGVYRNGLAKLSTSGTGAVDSVWNPNALGGATVAIQLDNASHLYVGGNFTSVGGLSRLRVARLSTSGTGAADTWKPAFDSSVKSLTATPAGTTVAGGVFLNAGGSRHFGFAEISSGGTVSASAPDAETHGVVRALAPLADGSMIVGGDFMKSGQQTRRNFLRLQADGALDPSWIVVADQPVLSLADDGAGNVYAGGEFTSVNGQARTQVAKLSDSATGALDLTWSPAVNGPVLALALDGGNVYLGGQFTQVGAQTYNGGFARVSASGAGAVDTGWIPFATDAANDGGNVESLALDGGYLYAGGPMGDGDGGNLFGLVRYSTAGNGTPDASWNPSLYNSDFFSGTHVNAIVPDGTGNLFIGGLFDNVGSQARSNIAKVSATDTGSADATWDPSSDQAVGALLSDGHGSLYAGGGFANIGGQARRSVAKLSQTGTGAADANWNPSTDGTVHALVANPINGDIYAGGDFSTTGTELRFGFAAFASDVLFSNGFDGSISQ